MFFIGGILIGLVGGFAIMTVFGFAVALLRMFRLLWGERRVLVTITAVIISFAGLSLAAYARGETQDHLQRAFENCLCAGWIAGVVLSWLGIVGLLCAWGKSWKDPFKAWSWAGTALALVVGLFFAIDVGKAPQQRRLGKEKAEREWIAAIEARDYAVLKNHDGDWGYLEQLGASPLGFAVNENDADLLAFLAKAHPKPQMIDGEVAERIIATENLDLLDVFLKARRHPHAAGQFVSVAASKGRNDLMEPLLENGAPAQLPSNFTPIMRAASNGHVETVRLLAHHGADPNAVTRHRSEWAGDTALQQAAKAGHLDVCRLLLELGAKPDLRHEPNGTTALIHAAQAGNVRIVELLLAANADVSLTDRQTRTALHLAVMHSDSERTIQLLLDAGADPDAKDRFGFAPRVRLAKLGR